MRELIENIDLKLSFAGHETFPLRLLWLKKAHNAVAHGAPNRLFADPDAIARFGVGRNMALSMRFWADAVGTIHDDGQRLLPSEFGARLLADDGWDPYLEQAASLWAIHARLAADPRRTTTFFAFNALNVPDFEAATLQKQLEEVARARPTSRASAVTIKRDVEVFIRSYVSRRDMGGEDAAEPLLAELGLLRETRYGGHFEFVRGPKPTLPDGVFAYALERFWRAQAANAPAITVEQASYAVGSPGRIFKLDEHSVASRLMAMEALTDGAWRWTDTAGLRQLQRVASVDDLGMLATCYAGSLQ
ncbi:hypothetical protein HNP52_000068 [Sphingomonas kyeonggiensis]|uniref:DUF4007 domain-containing protein n=1 Tax=Sphingomonas kyeonggiensis TaxID=1268553 RepID=A0A7W7NQR2_9SPHN|nr:DUF4007 family protein [Sphingomonas kyeonggiensis]MBB4837017.1 hypothetical protein [Sphingomonas kyeonggiensis]